MNPYVQSTGRPLRRLGITLTMAAAMSCAVAAFWPSQLVQAQSVFAEVDDKGEIEAITRARHDLKLGFPVGGVVEEVLVKPGEKVKAGQVLMRLEDREGLSLVELYELRANSDLQQRHAEMQHEVAKVELESVQQMFDQDAAAPIELRRATAQAKVAGIEVELTEQQATEARLQLNQAKARHEKYIIKAPLDGVMEEIIVETGETVEALKPVMRMVVTDPLRIDAAVRTAETLGLKVGDPVWVRSPLSEDDKPIVGKIVHLASVADAASNTRLVRVEIPNESGVPAGIHVRVGFKAPNGLAHAGEKARQPEVTQ